MQIDSEADHRQTRLVVRLDSNHPAWLSRIDNVSVLVDVYLHPATIPDHDRLMARSSTQNRVAVLLHSIYGRVELGRPRIWRHKAFVIVCVHSAGHILGLPGSGSRRWRVHPWTAATTTLVLFYPACAAVNHK
jgi:hypothetical protein